MALVEQIPLTKACGSQRNPEALYSPFVPLQYKGFASLFISWGLRRIDIHNRGLHYSGGARTGDGTG